MARCVRDRWKLVRQQTEAGRLVEACVRESMCALQHWPCLQRDGVGTESIHGRSDEDGTEVFSSLVRHLFILERLRQHQFLVGSVS